jgi:hypothetical protein
MLFGALVLFGAPAFAQEPLPRPAEELEADLLEPELQGPAPGDPTDAEVRADMWQRLRDLERIRYPDGDETSAIGNEQDGNDLRSGTPALANSDREPMFLDSGELYDRSRAMVEDGTTFTHAPRAAREIAKPAAHRAEPRQRPPIGRTSTPETKSGGAALWVVPLVVGAALGLITYLRAKAKV